MLKGTCKPIPAKKSFGVTGKKKPNEIRLWYYSINDKCIFEDTEEQRYLYQTTK